MITTKAPTRRVLVLGDDLRIVLPIVRSLGRKGIEVHAAWLSAGSPVRSSRYLSRVHELSGFLEGTEWVEALRSLLGDGSYDLVIPATEVVVHVLHARRGELEPFARVSLPAPEIFDVVFDKARMQDIAQSLDVRVPKSSVAASLEDVERFCEEAGGRVVLKPRTSISDCLGDGRRYVQIFEDAAACPAAAARFFQLGQSVVLQEYREGVGVGVVFLAQDGRLLTTFQHRRLHETSGHGSTYREGTPTSPELRGATERIVESLRYTGVGMCEFRVDPNDGSWVFLELNARFWGSLALACASGADFPWNLYRMQVCGETAFPDGGTGGLRCRDLRPDFRWMWRSWRRRGTAHAGDVEQRAGWRLNESSRWSVLRDALRVFSPRDRIDSLALDDVRPFLRDVGQLVAGAARTLFRAEPSPRGSAPRLVSVSGAECLQPGQLPATR